MSVSVDDVDTDEIIDSFEDDDGPSPPGDRDGGSGGPDFNRRWLAGLLGLGAGTAAAQRFVDGGIVGLIRFVIVDFLYTELLRPAALSIWISGVATVDSLLIVGFGTDYLPGVTPGSSIGIVDLPFVFTAPIVGSVNVGTSLLLGGINDFNTAVATTLIQPLGIAAQPAVAGFWAVEISVLFWALWIGVQTIDVATGGTIDSVIDIGQVATRPAVNLWRFFFG